MKLHEPATFWTDCALAVLSGALALGLVHHAPPDISPLTGWWIGAFATCALAALGGAIHHGLGEEIPPALNRAAWRLALLGLVGTGLCLLEVAAHLTLSGPAFTGAQIAIGLLTATFAVAALRIDKFYVALCAYGLGQLAVLAAALVSRHHHSTAHTLWLSVGVATSALAAAIQHFRLSPAPRFNHNDLYHVVQFAAQGFFYLGAVAAF
jgi:hypothetical protein